MELVCPNCSTRFNVPDHALGTNGRSVKCSQCNHVWHARLTGPQGDAATAPTGPSPGSQPEAFRDRRQVSATDHRVENDSLDAGNGAAPEAEPAPLWDRPHSAAPYPEFPARRRGWAWVVVGLLLLAAVALTYVMRDEIANAVPASKRLYALAEIPLRQVGEGLEFIELQSARREADGRSVLDVSGFVRNRTDIQHAVPNIRVVVLNTREEEVAEFLESAPAPLIDPRGVVRFSYELSLPDTVAENLEVKVDFAEPANR